LGPVRETAPSYLPLRLQPLIEPPPGAGPLGGDYSPVELPHLYPGSTLVLFLADLPQFKGMGDAWDLGGGKKYDLGLKAATGPGPGGAAPVWSPKDWQGRFVADPGKVLTRLARAGVHLAVVHVKLNPTADDWLTGGFRPPSA
jgi:hypothetical protein